MTFHIFAAQHCEMSKFRLRYWDGVGVVVVFYTEFPCNRTFHPFYLFCEGSGWGNEEATVACREQGYQYGIGGECIDHHHTFEINPSSCNCHSKCFPLVIIHSALLSQFTASNWKLFDLRLHYNTTCSPLNLLLRPTEINPCSASLYAHITIRSSDLWFLYVDSYLLILNFFLQVSNYINFKRV